MKLGARRHYLLLGTHLPEWDWYTRRQDAAATSFFSLHRHRHHHRCRIILPFNKLDALDLL